MQEFDSVYGTALSMAQTGGFGTTPAKGDIADWFIDQIEQDAVHPFLGHIKRAGIEGSYPESVLQGDFDGDSQLDSLYSDPYHDCGKGRIVVVLADDTTTEWTRDTSGVLGSAACKAHFGAAIAVGDFDNDGYDDVAVTAPGSTVSSAEQAGDLSILYGSSGGLTDVGDQLLSQDTSGLLDSAETYDFFGESLTSADFNCDGYKDLAVGAPRDDDGSVFDAGMVHVIYGSSGGLSTVDSVWFQGGSVNDTAETGDHFGAALAAGNFDGDINATNSKECMDLAIGAPGEDLGTSPTFVTDAGFVYIAKGGTSGLSTTGDLELHQDVVSVVDSEEANDRFGAALEAVDDGTYWGLIVQVPGEACSALSENVGKHRFYGSSGGITTTSNALSCDEFDERFNSRDHGVLNQLADYYAIKVLANL